MLDHTGTLLLRDGAHLNLGYHESIGAADSIMAARRSASLSWLLGDGRENGTRIRRQLTYKEKMTMSPLQKFKKYRRFPWALTTHILVVITTITYILLHNAEYADFVNANEQSFRSALMNTDVNPLGRSTIYTVSVLVQHLQVATTNYFQYHNTSIGSVTTLVCCVDF